MTSNYDLGGSSESEEEIDYELWYRFPPQASLDEITKTLVFESTPFTENFLEFKKVGSLNLFKVKKFNQNVDNLVSKSKVYKEQIPTITQDLSAHEALAHLIESPLVKAEGTWSSQGKGLVEGILSDKLKESLSLVASNTKYSISNTLNNVDNSLSLSSQDECSQNILSTLQADKLSTSSSLLSGPFKDKLSAIPADDCIQDKFLRKILTSHLKGTTILDLVLQFLEPQHLNTFKDLDELKMNCAALRQALNTSRQFIDITNLSLAKSWAAFRTNLRSQVSACVMPEELRSVMQESSLWTNDLWSDEQKEKFIHMARQCEASKTFKCFPHNRFKRKKTHNSFPPSHYGNTNKAKTTHSYRRGRHSQR